MDVMGKDNGSEGANEARGNILVVDDNPQNLRLLVGMLSEKGYRVRPAPNGALALRSVQSTLPDLILLDIKMPDMDGYEVCRKLKADSRARDVPVIFISSKVETAGKLKAFGAGGVDYITKPFQLDEVMARVETHMTLRDMQKKLKEQNIRLQHEIEERKRLEKALLQKEKLKTLGTIAAEVAHEIRNPLISIGGFAQRLKRRFPDLPECDIILSESQRLEKILLRIRNYLQPMEINPQKCSVNVIIKECMNLLSPEMDLKQIMRPLDLNPELPAVHVDPGILTEICINLIRNAAEAMNKGGALNIKTFENDQDVNIQFKNQAPAIKVKDADALFMPFSEGGRSFGLPLCYRLLKDMGGLLSFTQEKDYVIFTVSLPKGD
jgi:CheY-like chemotaxis protein